MRFRRRRQRNKESMRWNERKREESVIVCVCVCVCLCVCVCVCAWGGSAHGCISYRCDSGRGSVISAGRLRNGGCVSWHGGLIECVTTVTCDTSQLPPFPRTLSPGLTAR